MGGSTVERVVLRAAVGNDNYGDVEKLAALLDTLVRRGVISEQGLSLLLATLADEIVTQKVRAEFGGDLSIGAGLADTPPTED